MDTLSLAGELAETVITGYLAHLAWKEEVKKICFLLVQHAV